jgi:pseudouridine-5'-phosphate glycosidase
VSVVIAPSVATAVDARQPVVALESALITHGLPQPTNLQVAADLENIIRNAGALPATIGIVSGRVKVGLATADIDHLAQADLAHKVSVRDLPVAVAQGWNGGTTVAATAWAAHRAGIQVFATGGIGGVHPGAHLDISADLPMLAQTPIVVVTAGAKAILDLPRTVEWLETHGIPVIGYGTHEFPAFYSRESGLPVDVRADSPAEVAAIVSASRQLALRSAIIIAVPVPTRAAIPAYEIAEALADAEEEAHAAGITGQALTPFLLSRLDALTAGASTRANIALLENNAAVAAAIATAIADQGTHSQ